MAQFRSAPARPGQAVIVSADVRQILRGAKRHDVELVLVFHVRFQPFGRLPAISGRPATAIDLAQNILRRRDAILDPDVLEHQIGEAETRSQQVNGLVVALGFERRLHDLLAPLQRTVGSGARAVHFERAANRQQVGIVLAGIERRESGRMRIGDHKQIQLVHRLYRLREACDGIAAVSENDQRADRRALIDLIIRKQNAVEPSRRRDAGGLHVLAPRSCRAACFGGNFVEALFQPLVGHLPYTSPVLPGTFRQPVVERQCRDIEAKVRRALHVGVAAEDVGSEPRSPDIAGGQQRDA